MHHGIKKLLLLGGGHAHVHVLSRLAQQRPADLDITVVTPYPYQTYSGMVPGLVAGRYSEADCRIPLEPLIRAAGAKWVRARCSGIDAAGRRARLSPAGKSRSQDEILPPDLPYHLLSIDTGPVIDRQRLEDEIPGAADNALIVRPIEVFASLWPQVLEQAQARALSVAVIGAGWNCCSRPSSACARVAQPAPASRSSPGAWSPWPATLPACRRACCAGSSG
jgi:NADH dehydrogenase FAD-containing subunit